ncbi:12301_t:CDS:2, partial [Ambispora gerdemannii]
TPPIDPSNSELDRLIKELTPTMERQKEVSVREAERRKKYGRTTPRTEPTVAMLATLNRRRNKYLNYKRKRETKTLTSIYVSQATVHGWDAVESEELGDVDTVYCNAKLTTPILT